MASYYSGRMMLLSGQPLSLKEIAIIADASADVQIAPAAIAQMDASRAVVQHVTEDRVPVYGINTGFGKLCEVRIPGSELARLQLNLVRSHACGLGPPLS
jgi:histidine ammonia-lyase